MQHEENKHYFLCILGQIRNAAYKTLKYCMFNEGNKISFAIYVSLLFLPQIIPVVLLSSVNPNQCCGWFFIFEFFTCTFILFWFKHVLTTEISSRISSLLENVQKLKIKDCTWLRTSDSLNEGLPIKMTREKFQRKWYSRFNPRLIHKSRFLIGQVPNEKYELNNI